MPDNIIINPTVNQITVTEQVNSVIIRSPGPQGPAGVMIISQIPTISPIINTGSSIAFDQIAQYITLDARYAKITGSVQFSASSGSALYATSAGSATYSSSAGYATNSGSSTYSNTSASTLQTNFTTLSIAGSAVATQSYVNNASVLFAVLSSSAQYSSSAGYANLAGTSASLNGSPASSYALKTYVDSASLNAYNSASAFTLAQGYQTSTGSVLYASSAGTAVNSNTTSQTNFNPLTISGSAVATQNYVNSQDFQKSTGSVAFATNSGSSSYATNSSNSLTTSQTSFNNINITASTQSTNTVNGALIVSGGIGTGDSVNIGGNLNVTGNIFMSGSAFTIGASNLEVIDSIILLSASNYYSDLLDIGFYGAYGSTDHDSASNHYHTGLIRDHLDDKWKLFSSGSETSPNTIDFNTATYDTLKLGAIEVSSSAQVSNLNSQYLAGIGSASYARLDQAQTFSGLQTIQTSSSANKGLIIRSSASQTANLQEWQNSAGASLTAITNSGQILSTQRMTVGLSTISSLGNFVLGTGASARVGQVIIGSASQTANLQEWQNSDTTIMARVNNIGEIVTSTTVYANGVQNNTGFWSFNNNGVGQITARNATNIPLTLKGSASQTANLQEWQNSSGSALSTITSSGTFVSIVGGHTITQQNDTTVGLTILRNSTNSTWLQSWNNASYISAGGLLSVNTYGGQYGGALSVGTISPVNLGITVRGNTGQSADLLQIQSATPTTVRGGFNANGQLYTGSTQPILSLVSTTASIIGSATSGSVYTTTASHNLSVGQIVYISGVTPTGYNQSWNVLSIISSSAFVINSSIVANATVQGSVYLPAQLSVVTSGSTTPGIIVRASASQTANLQEWQDSSGSVLAGVNASGRMYTGSAGPVTNLAGTAQGQLSAVSSASNIIPLIVRRPSAGTVNTFEIQQSAGTPYVWVDQNMVLYSTAAFNAQPSTVDGTAINAYPTYGNHRGDLLKITNSSQTITRAAFNAIGQVYTGSAQPNLNAVSAISSINTSGVFASVTTTTSSNNLSVGQIIYITGASPNEYNGNFYVNTVISSSSFLVSKSSAFVTASAVTPGTVSLPAQLSIVTASANVSGISIQGQAGQQGNLLEFRNSSGTVVSNVIGNGDWLVPSLFNTYNGIGTGYSIYFGGITSLFVVPTSQTKIGGIFRQRNSLSTGDLTQWQLSTSSADYANGSTVAGVTASGQFYTGSSTIVNTTYGTPQIPQVFITTPSANVGLYLKSQSSAQKMFAIEDQSGVRRIDMAADGSMFIGGTIYLGGGLNATLTSTGTGNGAIFNTNTSTQTVPLTVRSTASINTADIQQWQANGAINVAGVTKIGQIYTGSTAPLTNTSGSTAQLSVVTSGSTTPGIIIRASASQTANLEEWQTSTGAILASISGGGSLTVNGNINGLNLRANGGDTAGGSGILAITNAVTIPTANPVTGGIIYVEAGALKYRGSGGGINTIAPAVSDGTILGDATIDGGSA